MLPALKPMPDPTAAGILDLIGHTPMVRAQHLDTGPCELYLKLESHNPAGSIKDRIALAMVEAAERDGSLRPGGMLVEATAGNTGLGLALVASQKGYRLTLVIPDKMSQEKIFHLKALGTRIVMTRSDVGKGHPEYYQDLAMKIAAETPGAVFVNQFANPANPLTHERSTGPEIWQQMGGRIDAMVCGVGSGGTMTGLGRFFRGVSPRTEMVLADPVGSILAPLVNEGKRVEAGNWLVEGIGEDFVPDNCDLKLITKAYAVTDADSIATSREVLLKEGIICGSSSGTLVAAALRYCREQTSSKRVVTLICDSGNKYLSKIYNEYWLEDQGFLARETTGDLRDLIARPFFKGNVVALSPCDTLQDAYRKMKMYDISQLPVMEDGGIVGLIDESDILLAVMGKPEGFRVPVGDAMSRKLLTIGVASKIDDLLPIFAQGMVAIVVDGDQFIGLVTPIDLLQYLRKRVGHA